MRRFCLLYCCSTTVKRMTALHLLLLFSVCLISVRGKSTGDLLHVKRAHYFKRVWDSRNFHVGGYAFSVFKPLSLAQGFYPLGDAINVDPYAESAGDQSLLVFDDLDGKVKPPIGIRLESSYGNTKRQKALGFTIYELLPPPDYTCLGFIMGTGHSSFVNKTVEDFRNYRCVHTRYATQAKSLEQYFRIVDHYDPSSSSYARTILWKIKTAQSSPPSESEISSETFSTESLFKQWPTLDTTLLTFANPLHNPEGPLILIETDDVKLIHSDQGINIWVPNDCCYLSQSLTSPAMRVVTNPNFVSGPGNPAPLARPISIESTKWYGDRNVHWAIAVCPPNYINMGQFLLHNNDGDSPTNIRCVHERYTTPGRWQSFNHKLYPETFALAQASKPNTGLSVSAFFFNYSASAANVLRRSKATVLSGKDVASISISSGYDNIWKNFEESHLNQTWLGKSNLSNCNATRGKPLLVINITEPLATVVQLAVDHPVETSFQVEFADFGVFNETPVSMRHQSFSVQNTTVSNQQMVVNQTVRPDHLVKYRIHGVQQTRRSNWTLDARINYVDGHHKTVKLNGSAVMVTYVNVTAEPVEISCTKPSNRVAIMGVETASHSSSSALLFNWFNLVALLVFHVRSFVN